MNPVAFYIGPIPVPWYGIFVVGGMLLACLVSYKEWKRRDNDTTIFWWMFSVVVLSSFFGARWFYLMFNPTDIDGWWSFFSISSGRSIIGGIIFSALITSLVIKLFNIPVDRREIMSVILPNMLLAQAVGRWGNFFNQELYGMAVDNLNYMPEFIQQGMYIEVDGNYSYYAPLFLYESIFDFIGWYLIKFIAKPNKNLKIGTHGSLYFMWYGITRASLELLRSSKYVMNINGFPTSFFWSIMFIVGGIVSFIILQWYYGEYDYIVSEWMPLKFKYLKSKLLLSFNYIKTSDISYYLDKTNLRSDYLLNLNKSKVNICRYKLLREKDYYAR